VGRNTRSPRWGGAIAGWELTRLARRGSPTIARVLVGLLLFAALFVVYLAAFPRDVAQLAKSNPGEVQRQLAEFGQDFALTFLLVQAAVVLLLTPLFVAGSIVEETERRTLEFLLATDLSPREIVLGKLWPRLLLMVGIVLVGWPVLAVTQVWGGVDVLFVCVASLIVLGATWAAAGISAACAVGASSLRRALIKSYAWSAVALTVPVITCPFAAITVLANAYANSFYRSNGNPPQANSAIADLVTMLAAVAVPVGIHALIGLLGIRRACFKLRHSRYFYARMPWQEKRPKPQHWEKHPPVPQGSPLLWKEIHLSGQTTRFVRLLGLVPWWLWVSVTAVFMVVGLAFLVAGGAHDVLYTMNGLVRWIGGWLVALMALVVGLHASGSVVRERQQGTLGDLLTVPHPRREILRAKWVGSLAKARGIALGAIAVPLVGVFAEGISVLAVPLLVAAAFAFVACAASFGLWLSVRARTVQRASGLWLLLVGGWVGGTFLAAQAAYIEERARQRMSAAWPPKPDEPLIWDRTLNPPLAWSQLTFRFPGEHEQIGSFRNELIDGWADRLEDPLPSLYGVALYAFLAWAFYRLAARRFEREGQG
jgi:ABC-type transport system involved in multi-copper enzyme maturation permease subunit